MDMQQLVNAMSKVGKGERSNYHATFGDLIEKLKNADSSARIHPKIVGLGAYCGYYSDIALCTQSGQHAYKTAMDYDNLPSAEDWGKWYKENEVKVELPEDPKELAKSLESLVGLYFDGYKGGYNQITHETPLWLAEDYGDCSSVAVVGISDSLELITKKIDY